MDRLLREYLPTAPDIGLYVVPEIPAQKLSAAIRDYASDVRADAVVALYDATRLGSAKDGALFLADRVVFQNNDLQAARTVRYQDIVGVRSRRKLLGGREVELDLNQGRATTTATLDFSGQPGAAEYVERFFEQALAASVSGPAPRQRREGETDRAAVEAALDDLRASGRLSAEDDRALRAVLR